MTDDQLPFTMIFAKSVDFGASDFDLVRELSFLRHTRPTGHCDQVLLFTKQSDEHADEVMIELMSRGIPVRRLNLDGSPGSWSLAVEFSGDGRPRGVLATDAGEILLDEVCSVWMRRPILRLFPDGAPPDPAAAFARSETEAGLRGLMALLDGARWVNPPASLWRAESKIRQLTVAASLGFSIPRTLVTSDPERAREFYRLCGGRVIVKPFRAQCGPRTQFRMIYASRVLPEHLELYDRVCHAPCIFQEEVRREADLRITMIGRRMFAVEIRNQSAAVDCRDGSFHAEYTPTKLPDAVEAACWSLMNRWQLASASIDMIRRPDGSHVFLEINSHHDWLWIQRATGLPLVEAMADLLEPGDGEQEERS